MKITIDPGHGQNTNKSPNNPSYVEGTQMWKLGQKLQKALESYGFEVINTRPNIGDDPSLSARGKSAGESGSSLLLSLHSNAPSASPDGTYDPSIKGVCACYSQKDKAFNQPLAKKLAETVGNLMGNGVKAVFYNSYPGKPGTDYFGVLRYSAASGCPHAIIIEHGYHTNVYESNWLLDDANLERLAREEARVIAECFGVEKKKIIYRVQVGAYFFKANATKLALRLEAKGFPCYIAKSGFYYRVQAGAYFTKGNATKMLNRLKDAGFDGFIVESEV